MVFIRWFSQGSIHALILLLICFTSQTFNTVSQGKNFDLWLHGQVLYLSLVLIVNLKILRQMHTYDLVGIVLISSMIVSFLLFYALENSITSFYQLSHTYSTFLSAPTQTYLCLIFCAVGLVFIIDPIVTLCYRLFINRDQLFSEMGTSQKKVRDCYTKLSEEMDLF